MSTMVSTTLSLFIPIYSILLCVLLSLFLDLLLSFVFGLDTVAIFELLLFFIVFGTAFLIGSIGLVKFGLSDEIFLILLLITSLFVAYKVVMKMIP